MLSRVLAWLKANRLIITATILSTIVAASLAISILAAASISVQSCNTAKGLLVHILDGQQNRIGAPGTPNAAYYKAHPGALAEAVKAYNAFIVKVKDTPCN